MGLREFLKGFSSSEQKTAERKKELIKRGPVSFEVEIDGKRKKFTSRDEALSFTEENEGAVALVNVAGIELEMWQGEGGSQYNSEDFANFALDQNAMELITIMAKSIALNQPPLIEGETDIGKSRSLEYLAYLTNHHLIYQSFSGQTDVSELIGKYVPRVSGDIPVSARKKIEGQIEEFEQLLKDNSDSDNKEKKNKKKEGKTKELSKESQRIVRLAQAEVRGYTQAEMKEIAKNEGFNFDDLNWEWQDGTVPRSMEYNGGAGAWLYFDELGAAEPQILVKLNRIMATEGMRRFEITENGGREVVGGKSYRLIASTNPPKYAGRIPFEKDFLRRWNYQKAKSLTEQDSLNRDLARELGVKPEVSEDIYWVGRRSEKIISDFKENGAATEIYSQLAALHTKFLFSARKLIEAQPVEHGEQQFRYEESDKIRTVQYLKKFQKPDLVETLREAVEFFYTGKVDSEKIVLTASGDKSLRVALMDLFDQTAELLKTREKVDGLLKKYEAIAKKESNANADEGSVEQGKATNVAMAGLDNLDEDAKAEIEDILKELE